MSEYVYNKPSICYYVNLNRYTKGKFGNTDFAPPLSDPIEKRKVVFAMPNYDSMYKPDVPTDNNYSLFNNAYNKPNCKVCSLSDCK